jgi:hypothetical protein
VRSHEFPEESKRILNILPLNQSASVFTTLFPFIIHRLAPKYSALAGWAILAIEQVLDLFVVALLKAPSHPSDVYRTEGSSATITTGDSNEESYTQCGMSASYPG